MKALVAIKQVIDPQIKIQVKLDGSGFDDRAVKRVMNPFDEIAVEEAVRLKEQSIVADIVLVTVGPMRCQDVLRTGLAMGGDRAILIETEQELEPLNIAKLLQKVVEKEHPSLILLGKQAVDNDANQVGQMLAGLLNYAQGTSISKLMVNEHDVVVTREIDEGTEQLRLTLPAVLTTDLLLNQPRYVKLPNLMKAKKKAIEVLTPEALNVELIQHTAILKVEESPNQTKKTVFIEDVQALADILERFS